MSTDNIKRSTNKLENYENLFGEIKDFTNGPIDQLLGSVSYADSDGVEGKIRTSARVFKKMRIDSITIEKKAEKKDEPKIEEVIKVEPKKCPSSVWNAEEKQIFFKGLNEFGKDFESVHSYLSAKLKRKGIKEDVIKTKHQVRHFYYKTFNFISNYVKFPEHIPKNIQELYSLINYGEIRRKIGSLPKKAYHKISELVYNGTTSLKFKGKTIRIKTPMCKALRRINQLDEKYDDLKLPTRVCLELRPRNMSAFLRVQSIAQNPRLKMAVSLQKRLSCVLNYVSNRWKTPEARMYDRSIISQNPFTKDCVPNQKELDIAISKLNPMLKLLPPPNATVELPSIDISEYFTGQSICFNAYESRKGIKNEIKKEEMVEMKVEKTSQKLNNEEIKPVNEIINSTVNSLLTLNKSSNNSELINIKNESNSITIKNEQIEKIDTIKDGWTLSTCSSLTIGEIYLMFGANSKVTLEYCWDEPPIDENDISTRLFRENNITNVLSNQLKKLLSLAKLQINKPPEISKCNCNHNNGNSNNNHHSKPFKRPLAPPKIKQTKPIVSQESTSEVESVQNSKPYHYPQNARMLHFFAQFDAMQRLNSKLNDKKGRRFKSRQLVVERNLIPTIIENDHQIVKMNIVSQEKPINDDNNKKSLIVSEKKQDNNDIIEQTHTIDNNNTIKEFMVNEENNDENNYRGLLSGASSPISSTTLGKILKENDSQLTYYDMNEYSLSSLLGNLEYQSKTNQSIDDTQLAQDVDSQLNKLLNETSVDFTAKFADLAAQVNDNK